MNYRKKVVLMLGVLSYLNLGTFSQAAPSTVDHTSVAVSYTHLTLPTT